MRWKRGDVVWSNNTLSDLMLGGLAACIVVPAVLVTLWNIFGLLLGF